MRWGTKVGMGNESARHKGGPVRGGGAGMGNEGGHGGRRRAWGTKARGARPTGQRYRARPSDAQRETGDFSLLAKILCSIHTQPVVFSSMLAKEYFVRFTGDHFKEILWFTLSQCLFPHILPLTSARASQCRLKNVFFNNRILEYQRRFANVRHTSIFPLPNKNIIA